MTEIGEIVPNGSGGRERQLSGDPAAGNNSAGRASLAQRGHSQSLRRDASFAVGEGRLVKRSSTGELGVRNAIGEAQIVCKRAQRDLHRRVM